MFHVEHEPTPTGLSPGQRAALDRFVELLGEVAAPRGLVGERDPARIRVRHVEDSLRALPYLRDARSCTDLGSGAGLPGIPLAIAQPHMRFRLVEARARRVAFLEMAVAELGLENVDVLQARAEKLGMTIRATIRATEATDACTARALADLRETWALARPLLLPGGRLIYFAGASFEVPESLEGAADLRIEPPDGLASGGPLVIITAE
jgi:16S rRNA (guanine527-N7)-methyltransferase